MPFNQPTTPVQGEQALDPQTPVDNFASIDENIYEEDGHTKADVAALARREWPTTYAMEFLGDLAVSLTDDVEGWEQPWDTLDDRYQQYRPLFEEAHSPSAWNQAIMDANQEIGDDELRRDMSASDWAYYMGVSAADPISVLLAIGTGGLAVVGRGLTLGQAAARTGALTAAEATAIEGLLQATDPMRTAKESAISIVASGAIGAFIGPAMQGAYNVVKGSADDPVRKEIIKVATEEVELEEAQAKLMVAQSKGEPLPAPDRATSETPIDAEEVGEAIDDTFAGLVTTVKEEKPLFSPLKPLIHNRLARSSQTIMQYNGVSPSFSRMADVFGANNILKKGDYSGTRYNGKTFNEEVKMAERHAFRTMSDSATVARQGLKKRGIKLTDDQVARQAGLAARKGALKDDFEPEVWAVGQKFRGQLDAWKDRAQATRLLEDYDVRIADLDTKIAKLKGKTLTPKQQKKLNLLNNTRNQYKKAQRDLEDYVPRFWDLEEVAARPAHFRTVIKRWASAKHNDLTEDQLDDLVDDVRDSLSRINNGEKHSMTFHVKQRDPKSGHLQARRIDAEDLELVDFLVSDVRVLADRYARNVGSDVIAREIYGVDNVIDIDGVPMPADLWRQGIREFNAARKVLEPKAEAGSKLAKRKLKKLDANRTLTMDAATDYVRGIMRRPKPPTKALYSKLDDIANDVRGYASSAVLGGVVEAAIPDPANNILQHGLAATFSALPRFFKSLPSLATRGPSRNAEARHWRDMDVALDMLMSNRMFDIAGVEDKTKIGIKKGAFSGTEVARKSFRLFLADRWNTAFKMLAAITAEKRILRDAAKLSTGKLSKHRTAKMRRIGMTEEMATRIHQNNKTAGKTRGIPNIDDWDEMTQADMKRMLFRESEFQVLAPDSGEIPLIMDNLVGKMFMQFKSFVISNAMKQNLPRSQRFWAGDMSVLAGLTALGGLAIFSRYVRDVRKSFEMGEGFDIDSVNDEWANKTPMDLAAIAVTDGSLLSYLPSLLGALDNQMNNQLGVAVGMTERKRFYSPGLGIEKNAPGFGWLGTAKDAAIEGAQAALPTDSPFYSPYTAQSLNKAMRSVPTNNTFYLQWLFNMGEEAIADEFNLPDSSREANKTSY